jgi:hypothetical protein
MLILLNCRVGFFYFMPDVEFQRLLYRGNFALKRKLDFSESLLSTRYAGGFREDVIVGSPNGLRSWSLTYSALINRVNLNLPGNIIKDRLSYIWDFFSASKSGGNIPFIITDPEDNKDYLAIFSALFIEVDKVDFYLSTTGLQIEQLFVRGVNTLADGSLGTAENPDEI